MSVPINLELPDKHSLSEGMPLILTCYGITHAMVDATCAATVLSISGIHSVSLEYATFLVVLYNILAFGTQAILGLGVDHFRAPRMAAIIGCVLTASAAAVVFFEPLVATIIAGIGNSLFHVGGGSISLNLTPERTTAPGIFVAPGAFGLGVGVYIGLHGYFIMWPFVLLLMLACIAIYFIQTPDINYNIKKFELKEGLFELILLLLMLSVAVRGLVGLSLTLPWKSNIVLLIALTLGIVFGKAISGILADKFGWMRVGITALVISMPLIAFGYQIPAVAIIGAFLFQMTMPITLVAVATMFSGRPAFGFGLPCLALIIGALPSFTTLKTFYTDSFVILGTIAVGFIALTAGLILYFKNPIFLKE